MTIQKRNIDAGVKFLILSIFNLIEVYSRSDLQFKSGIDLKCVTTELCQLSIGIFEKYVPLEILKNSLYTVIFSFYHNSTVGGRSCRNIYDNTRGIWRDRPPRGSQQHKIGFLAYRTTQLAKLSFLKMQ